MPMDETCPKQKQIRGEIQMSIDFLKTLETGISSIDVAPPGVPGTFIWLRRPIT